MSAAFTTSTTPLRQPSKIENLGGRRQMTYHYKQCGALCHHHVKNDYEVIRPCCQQYKRRRVHLWGYGL